MTRRPREVATLGSRAPAAEDVTRDQDARLAAIAELMRPGPQRPLPPVPSLAQLARRRALAIRNVSSEEPSP